MTPDVRKRRPQPGNAAVNLAIPSLSPVDEDQADPRALDVATMATDLDGALVVRVVVTDGGQTRDLLYRTSSGAELALRRAEARGRKAVVLMCRLTPVGEVLL